MRILFFTLHWGYLRHYDSALRQLAAGGHELHLVAEKEDKIGSFALIEALERDFSSITHGYAPDRRRDPWLYVGSWIRLGLDYLRYLRPEYARFQKLYRRSRSRTPWTIVALTDIPAMRSEKRLSGLARGLRAMEQLLPANEDIADLIREQHPDLVLLTPLLGLGTSQYDDLRAAKELALKTVLCVGSWDHLSSKALIRFAPDLVTVWNNTQLREAVEMHSIPAERVAVTGAQGWDRWFGRQPSRTREKFCADVGLDPSRPYLLWLCSTPFPGSPPEAGLVKRWIDHLRASPEPRLWGAGILVRPHPQRMAEWEALDLAGVPNLTVWGANPVTRSSQVDYFDSMYYCTAAVGLNTSAMIEAGILGKSVHTIFAPEFHDSQLETVHFHYLREVGGGLLHEAESLEQNAEQMLAAIERDGEPDPKSLRFTQAFVRPHGLDQAATPRFVAAVEALLESSQPPAQEEAVGSPALRALLRPLIAFLYVTVGLFQATPLGLRIHRGKKLVRAILTRILKLNRRFWGRTRKMARYGLKFLRLAWYRTGKFWHLATHRMRKKTGAIGRVLRLLVHRLKKKIIAGRQLLVEWIRPGGSPVE